jgi:hypothetical protein
LDKARAKVLRSYLEYAHGVPQSLRATADDVIE